MPCSREMNANLLALEFLTLIIDLFMLFISQNVLQRKCLSCVDLKTKRLIDSTNGLRKAVEFKMDKAEIFEKYDIYCKLAVVDVKAVLPQSCSKVESLISKDWKNIIYKS